MCGISFCLFNQSVARDSTSSRTLLQSEIERLYHVNGQRGPDGQNTVKEIYPTRHDGPDKLILDFFASELRLRGELPITQPHASNGSILCWNGEIFGGLDVPSSENDGLALLDKLCSMETSEGIRRTFSKIEGPYAFVLLHKKTETLYWSRDPIGRRSLLVHNPTEEEPYFILASTSAGSNSKLQFEELSATSLYSLDLSMLAVDCNIMERFVKCLTIFPQHYSPSVCRENPCVDYPIRSSLDPVPIEMDDTVDEFLSVLEDSVRRRLSNIPERSDIDQNQAHVAVLFSGGIDSAAIAYLAHRHVPFNQPIDLLNVAFENPFKIKNQHEGHLGGLTKRQKRDRLQGDPTAALPKTSYRVPDRITGSQELQELKKLCPGRIWKFVEINIPYEEALESKQIIEDLVHPSKTVMDISLAQALYFASRGQGQVQENDTEPVPYTSPAKILLNGLGSDELLGGYGRHRTAYSSGGWEAVIDELQLELERIPTRNLGRDDRVISSHGKEVRHPFLSLDVISFVTRLPAHLKMDPRAELGIGDKLLLRLAMRKVGMVEASTRKKKAMQFGSHSARMEGQRRGDVDFSNH